MAIAVHYESGALLSRESPNSLNLPKIQRNYQEAWTVARKVVQKKKLERKQKQIASTKTT
jgi:hypothetical protein